MSMATGTVSVSSTQNDDGTGKVSSITLTYDNPTPPPDEIEKSWTVGNDGATLRQWDIAVAMDAAGETVEVIWADTSPYRMTSIKKV